MTRTEAEALMTRIGCIDTRNVACLHIVYARYCHERGLGNMQKLPVAEAYALLVAAIKEDKGKVPQQQALFNTSRSAL